MARRREPDPLLENEENQNRQCTGNSFTWRCCILLVALLVIFLLALTAAINFFLVEQLKNRVAQMEQQIGQVQVLHVNDDLFPHSNV